MKVIDDVFTDAEFQQLRFEFFTLIDTSDPLKSNPTMWTTNRFAWQPYLYRGKSGHVLSHNVSDQNREIVMKKILEHITPKEPPNVQYYVWGPGSGINRHNDDGYGAAFTFYLDDWPIEWGGQLHAILDNRPCIIPTKRNRMVINDNKCDHWVTPVRNIRDRMRFTIQVFVP